MIRLCATLGLANNLVKVPDFRIQRALLDTQFARARRELEAKAGDETLRELLEREYQLFTESVNQWRALQSERYERKVAGLGDALEARRLQMLDKWEHATLRSRLRELEYALKNQRKRLGMLLQQLQMPSPAGV
jgi:stearoyl-CoA desaturase (delta-9 desaturase)